MPVTGVLSGTGISGITWGAARIAAHEVRLGERRDDFFRSGKILSSLAIATGSSLPVYLPAIEEDVALKTATATSPCVREMMRSMPKRSLSRSSAANAVAVRRHRVRSRCRQPWWSMSMTWKRNPLIIGGSISLGAIHGISEGEVERQVVGAGAVHLSAANTMKDLAGSHAREAVVEAELGDSRAGAAKVSGRGVDEEILAGSVEPGGFRDRGGREKRLPGELMYPGASLSPCACVMMIAMSSPVWRTKPSIRRRLSIAFATSPSTVSPDHARRRFRMSADGANVSLDDRKGESHEHFSRSHSATLGARCAGATALLIGGKNVWCCDRFHTHTR